MNEKQDLKETDSGTQVTLLQSLLRINEYFPGTITGVFGPDTKTWVETFQKENNLLVTGTATDETWELLYKMTNPATSSKSVLNKPVIQIGDSGEEVREVQFILKDLGYYNGDINGIFDETLYVAVQSFQFINKLVPEGVVGSNTWSALIDLYSPLSNCEGSTEGNVNLYTVVKGDSLYSIAKKYNTTVAEIKSLNNLTSDILSIGQILKLPTSSSGGVDPLPTENYTVQPGDTLYSIARKFNTTVENLRNLNNLSSDILSIGQVLKITEREEEIPPPDPSPTEYYIVQPGDTLYSIAIKYNTTVDNLKFLNNLISNTLSVGQTLKVTGENTGGITPPLDPEIPTSTYTVQKGDTLYSIARKFNMSVSDLKALNNLTSDILSIGQVLKVSGEVPESITYIVMPGDTLYSIARTFNTTVDNLIRLNNLSGNILSIGQVLKIN